MIIGVALVLLIGVFLFVLGIRSKDLPEPEVVSPTAYLEERKSRIYEGLRDLQFEYRLGKLSDEDYQRTKLDLQKELTVVLAEIDRVSGKAAPAAKVESKPAAAPVAAAAKPDPNKCPSCGATFEKALKFCGECGKPMPEVTA